MQATFNGAFTDGTFKQAAFKMNQLRLEARGDIMTGFLTAGSTLEQQQHASRAG